MKPTAVFLYVSLQYLKNHNYSVETSFKMGTQPWHWVMLSIISFLMGDLVYNYVVEQRYATSKWVPLGNGVSDDQWNKECTKFSHVLNKIIINEYKFAEMGRLLKWFFFFFFDNFCFKV